MAIFWHHSPAYPLFGLCQPLMRVLCLRYLPQGDHKRVCGSVKICSENLKIGSFARSAILPRARFSSFFAILLSSPASASQVFNFVLFITWKTNRLKIKLEFVKCSPPECAGMEYKINNSLNLIFSAVIRSSKTDSIVSYLLRCKSPKDRSRVGRDCDCPNA